MGTGPFSTRVKQLQQEDYNWHPFRTKICTMWYSNSIFIPHLHCMQPMYRNTLIIKHVPHSCNTEQSVKMWIVVFVTCCNFLGKHAWWLKSCGMLHHVNWYIVIDYNNEGITIFQNISNYLPMTALHSAAPLWERKPALCSVVFGIKCCAGERLSCLGFLWFSLVLPGKHHLSTWS
jgi:hypothetical protein